MHPIRIIFRTLALVLLLTLPACAAQPAAASGGAAAAGSEAATVSDVPAVAAAPETAGFSDVPADADYAQAALWCREKGLMLGVGDNRFHPEGAVTRAALVTVLYRAEGMPAVTGAVPFSDVAAGAWYADAVTWAGETGLVQGYGNGTFGAAHPVSVGQLETVLSRYAGTAPKETGRAAEAATRAQVAAALYAALHDKGEQDVMKEITLSFNGHTYTADLEENSSAEAFAQLLREGPLTVSARDYGGFEKVAPLGTELPRNDRQITVSAGDLILYQGNQITVYYAQNSWSLTRLGGIRDPEGLREALGDGSVEITFRLSD